MKTKKLVAAAVLWCMVFLFFVQVPVMADVPTAVLEAKSGVVRIITVGDFGVFTGSGFIVGTPEKAYVITNYHVVEDTDTFYIFYDTGRYISAKLYHQDPSRDLCVLKPNTAVPKSLILPIETRDFESGIGVYALGYPAAADSFTQGEEDFETEKEYLASVTADKKSMTITDGIVSAIHSSKLIGDGTRAVETLQTNTVLNGGNSGGPLLNQEGLVVGVNTMGLANADGINGAVHASEIVRVLKEARVKFLTSYESEETQPEEEKPKNSPAGGIILAVAAVVIFGGVFIALILLKQKKPRVKGGISLEDFEKTYRKVEELASIEMVLRFVKELLPLANYDLNPLFTPQNVVIGDTEITLKEKSAKPQIGPRPVFDGYTAPEIASGQALPASTVYFIGGILYTMITGRRPQNSLQRLATNQPALAGTHPLNGLINRAMEPQIQNRIQNLHQLCAEMEQLANSLRRYG